MRNYFITRHIALPTNNTLGEVSNIPTHIRLLHYGAYGGRIGTFELRIIS
jgi:hypothetical protein